MRISLVLKKALSTPGISAQSVPPTQPVTTIAAITNGDEPPVPPR